MLNEMTERPLRRRQIPFVLLAASLLFVGACSDDPDPGGDIIPRTNYQSGPDVDDGDIEDVGDVDEGDADDAEDVDQGDSGDADDAGDGDAHEDPDENQGDSVCGAIIDLGVISGPYEETFIVEFADADDRFRTTCEESEDGHPEVIFQYELEGDGNLSVSSAEEVILELRGDACVDQQAVVCAVGELKDYMGWPTQYLLVEKLNDDTPDQVQITIRYDQFNECEVSEIGDSACVDDERIRACDVTFAAPDIPNWLEFDCPAGCEDDRCTGDSCSAPIVVTESIEFTTLQHILHNEHNSLGVDQCGPSGGEGEDLEGRELVFALTDLASDSEVIISASQDSYYVGQQINLLFKEQCEDETICLDFHQGDGVYTFIPPAAGTYYLFVDLPMDFDGETSISIEIRDNQ